MFLPPQCSFLHFLSHLGPVPERFLTETQIYFIQSNTGVSDRRWRDAGVTLCDAQTRTEHGLQFDHTAGEVVEVNDLMVGVAGDEHLIQSVVQSEP